jgi:hypothetical protein
MFASRKTAGLVACAVITSIALLSGQSRDVDRGPARDPDRQKNSRPVFICGTRPTTLEGLALAPRGLLAAGQPVYYQQTPAIIRPDITTSFRIEVTVVGDFATLKFTRNDPQKNNPTETWSRTSTANAGGQLVSVFAKTYPASEFARILRRVIHGFDYPDVRWGEVHSPVSGAQFFLRLRVGSSNLPVSPVTVINGDVRYSSHVVNLVIPDVGAARIAGGDHDYDQERVARLFFEHFQDIYQVLAIVPQDMHLATYGGFHQAVKNEVSGINVPLFNRSAQYGSGGTLEGIEVYPQVGAAANDIVDHELTHQWGNQLDWAGLAGIPRAGHQPESHSPLWAVGETFIGAALEGTRRVANGSGGYEVEMTPFPIRQHPVEMYLMGKYGPGQVPDVMVFENQGQFDASTSSAPKEGTSVTGGARAVGINAIMARHGARSGPSPGLYRQALIYVSRTPATQAEMDFWNFFAQRREDTRRVGVMSFDGYPSFDVATRNMVDLDTDIFPRSGAKVTKALNTDFPSFGRTDVPGVTFDKVVPGSYTAGSTVRVSGKVTATDRSDFDGILIRFFKAGDGGGGGSVDFRAPVSRSKTFAVDVRFSTAQKGAYGMDVFLFWPGAGAQFPRSGLTPVHVR